MHGSRSLEGCFRVVALAALLIAARSADPARAEADPAVAGPPAESASDRALLDELVAITAEIEEGVRVGDRAAVERRTLPEMLLVNRDGKTYTQRDLLDELVPLRPGYDLRFTVLEPQLRRSGDAALLTFLLDEHLTIHGQDVSTAYRCNFLYFRRDGAWKLALFEYFEKPVDPDRVTLPAARLDEVAGTYELAPGAWVTKVWREGEKLMSRRDDGAPVELVPFASDRFYRAGIEGESFFVRDETGKVTGMRFRRNFKDLVYRKVK